MKGESTRTILFSLLAAASALTVAGCTLRQSAEQPPSGQAASTSSPAAIEGSCKSPHVPPADVADKPGYTQFDVAVTNSLGWPVSGLATQDFVLYSGSQIFPVAYFREHKNDDPVAIALVVDTSGKMATRLPVVKQTLGDFVRNLNPCDELALFAFNSQVYVVQPFSTDHQMAAESLNLLKAYGKSALYDATSTALQSLEGADNPNRKFILITDGIDNSSATTESEVVAQATKDRIPIYAIGIGDPNAPKRPRIAWGQAYAPSAPPIVVGPPNIGTHTVDMPSILHARPGTDRVDPGSLEDLSAVSGGRSFIAPSRGEVEGSSLETAIFAIAENIAGGYAIGVVVPANVNPTAVKVTIPTRLDLEVRAHPIAASPKHD
ncbi:MAG: VWA domain-containing protein [Candidatus Binatus sp.]|jgi:VWFA-related protein|uniref:VWA domain-containing protein n=1 Tax=Candidatus Binatus sp. TaxID=2811406 RepID=UPI003C75F663